MTGQKSSQGGPRTREERLAEALRANLRRRKAAARASREAAPEAGEAPEPEDSLKESGPSGRRS